MTIVVGVVFVLGYFVKQLFNARQIGWFIGAGVLISFCLQMGVNTQGLIAMIFGAISLFMFFFSNREPIEDALIHGRKVPVKTISTDTDGNAGSEEKVSEQANENPNLDSEHDTAS